MTDYKSLYLKYKRKYNNLKKGGSGSILELFPTFYYNYNDIKEITDPNENIISKKRYNFTNLNIFYYFCYNYIKNHSKSNLYLYKPTENKTYERIIINEISILNKEEISEGLFKKKKILITTVQIPNYDNKGKLIDNFLIFENGLKNIFIVCYD